MEGSFADRSRVAVREAAGLAGLSCEGVELLRVGDRAVFRLAEGRVIARVARPGGFGNAQREVKVARWLLSEGMPVVEPLAGQQPVDADGLAVSLWWTAEGDWTTPVELGRLLRRFHSLKPPGSLSLPGLDVLDQARGRAKRARGLSAAEHDVLLGAADRLDGELAGVEFELPRSVIHGDANIGNVLKQPDGRVVMFDLGGVCWGPPEWDLTATAVYRDLGWHSRDQYREFCEVYGFDVTRMSGWPVLKSLQELRMVCWLALKFQDGEEIAEEVRRRVDDLANPERSRDWRPY